jgi:hypothetical protein
MQKNVAEKEQSEQGIMGTLELQPRMREPSLFPPGEMMEGEGARARCRNGGWGGGVQAGVPCADERLTLSAARRRIQ